MVRTVGVDLRCGYPPGAFVGRFRRLSQIKKYSGRSIPNLQADIGEEQAVGWLARSVEVEDQRVALAELFCDVELA